jgi:hypothetical protein
MPGMSETLSQCLWLGSGLMFGLEEILTTEDGQEDVDEEVGAAATLEEDSDGREEDGEDDLDDVAVCGLAGVAGCGVFWCRRRLPRCVRMRRRVGDLRSGESHCESCCGWLSWVVLVLVLLVDSWCESVVNAVQGGGAVYEGRGHAM